MFLYNPSGFQTDALPAFSELPNRFAFHPGSPARHERPASQAHLGIIHIQGVELVVLQKVNDLRDSFFRSVGGFSMRFDGGERTFHHAVHNAPGQHTETLRGSQFGISPWHRSSRPRTERRAMRFPFCKRESDHARLTQSANARCQVSRLGQTPATAKAVFDRASLRVFRPRTAHRVCRCRAFWGEFVLDRGLEKKVRVR